MPQARFGLSVALSTPFDAMSRVDEFKLIAHARRCIKDGTDSVTLFGTTGEGFAFSMAERAETIAAFKSAGFDMRRQVGIAIMATSIGDALTQFEQGLVADCRHFLLTPPFYSKGPTDEGVFNWHAALFAALGDAARDVIVYNLPSQTAVPLSLDLIDRLKTTFPTVIRGVKDSSSNLTFSQALVARHGDLAILIGDERHLADIVRRGGQGAICGVANFAAGRLRRLIDTGQDDQAITSIVDAVCSYPVLPAVKAVIAQAVNDPLWVNVRAPLVPLSSADATALYQRVRLHLSM
jgi:4-hydroxy-tetrahydrodipicolinate synthase